MQVEIFHLLYVMVTAEAPCFARKGEDQGWQNLCCWNSLSDELGRENPLPSFKSCLKTYIYHWHVLSVTINVILYLILTFSPVLFVIFTDCAYVFVSSPISHWL